MEFFAAGKTFKERAFVAPNRAGKSYAGGVELYFHLSGDYPYWWTGKVFRDPVKAIVCGKTNLAVRDVIQTVMCGNKYDMGSGIIPKTLIDSGKYTSKAGTTDAIQDLYIPHKSGGVSHCQFMSYDMSADALMGREIHVGWLDEECPNPMFYTELLTRTMTVGGIIYTTYTPLDGLTDSVLRFLPHGKFPEKGEVFDSDGERTGRYTVHCSWDDAPHLTKEEKDDMWMRFSESERLSRAQGYPNIGSGRIYPVLESDVVVAPFKIPTFYKKAYGLDFGWHKTAAIWGAQDPQTKVMYLYAEYYQGEKAPYLHAQALKMRGEGLIGAADPSGGGASAHDGSLLVNEYTQMGLNLYPAHNDITTGIARILNMLEAGQLKVFSTLYNWLNEFRVYRYGPDGKPARNQDDHLMDATKYLVSLFDQIAQSVDDFETRAYVDAYRQKNKTRDSITGY